MFSGRQAAARPVPDLHVFGFSFALLLFGEKKHMLLLLCVKWSISAATCLHTHGAICWLSTYCLSVVGVLYPVLTIYANMAMMTVVNQSAS